MNIHADLVFGDPWGLEGYDKERGDSVVISRTKIGGKIIRQMIESAKVKLKHVNYQDILKGQRIEERIVRTCQAINIYKKLGYKVPAYLEDLKDIEGNKELERRIVNFLKMEERSFQENIAHIKRIIQIKRIKSKVKQVIKKILFVEKWRR